MIRIGTRGSKLALVQAEWAADQLRRNGHEAEIIVIKTKGDVIKDRFDKMEGKGFFTAEIEAALLQDEIDLAVHCLKDLPTENPSGLKIVAIPEREDPRDCLVSARALAFSEDGVPQLDGLTVGTSSNRRVAGLAAWCPEATFVPIRGNVPTRIAKMEAGEADVVVLAQAGLNRLALQRDDLFFYPLTQDVLVPAPGQGALALQTRASFDTDLSFFHHEETARCADAERRVLRSLGGGCQTPLGAWVGKVDAGYRVKVFLGPQGESQTPIRLDLTGPDPETAVEAACRNLAESRE
ncbi:hydroxymethylbilane synthase [Sulfidibacter corallicola]|uniref:Hydroxymethylbilane synthase n=1 Tax=Sulfidibacter corallicola TaxID=2818388 RepID=A0A8A4U5Q0_SULCO|nr:hydroxymethylbilane synthase [Sulfidibacter corallicola]QTD54075.1 hydroxymethylbilane synthase [Sulfidibacter corallicola]